MAKGIKIQVKDKTFDSKKEAKAFFSEIINRYKLGDTLSELDTKYVSALFERHPEYPAMVGAGIKSIFVSNNDPDFPRSRNFNIVRPNGTSYYFGFHKCLDEEETIEHRFTEACRLAVQDQVKDFRTKEFYNNCAESLYRCPVTKNLVKFEDTEVHHVMIDFSLLVRTFITIYSVDLSKFNYLVSSRHFVPKAQAAFSDHHKKYASLQLLSKEGHKIAEKGPL